MKKIFVVISRLVAILILCAIPLSVGAQSKPTRDKSKDVVRVSPAKPKTSGVKQGTARSKVAQRKKSTRARTAYRRRNTRTRSRGRSRYTPSTVRRTPKVVQEPAAQAELLVNDSRFPSIEFSGDGGTEWLYISNGKWFTYDLKDLSWCDVKVYDDKIRLVAQVNPSFLFREGYVIIKKGAQEVKVLVSQKGHIKKPLLVNGQTDMSVTFPCDGGLRTLMVENADNWNYSIDDAGSKWLSVSKDGRLLRLSAGKNRSHSKSRYSSLKVFSGEEEVSVRVAQSPRTPYSRSKKVFAWGLDFDGEMGMRNNLYFSTGLVMRIGRANNFINATLGVKCRFLEIKPLNDKSYKYYGGAIAVPLNLRFNVLKAGRRNKWFIGAGMEYGKLFRKMEGVSMNEDYFSVFPMIGYRSSHFDFSVYYKTYYDDTFRKSSIFAEGTQALSKKYRDRSMIGAQMQIYF